MKKLIVAMAVLVACSYAMAQRQPGMNEPTPVKNGGLRYVPALEAMAKAARDSKSGECINGTVSTYPYREGFENGMNCWRTVDADADGYAWNAVAQAGLGYESDGAAASASYMNFVGELTPDNWLISPRFVLPAQGRYSLVWFASGLDARDNYEHYTVYVSTTDTVLSSFRTTVFSETLAGEGWVCRTVDLSGYAGQSIYVAFRHHDCTDQSALLIDDVQLHLSGTPIVAIDGPLSAMVGDTVDLRANLLSGSTSTSYAWQIQDAAISSATGATAMAVWDSMGRYRVTLTASNTVAVDTATLDIVILDCRRPLQMPYVETFEIGLGCWQLTDPAQHRVRWLTSPMIAVPATGESEASWLVAPYEPLSNSAHYDVYVATGGASPSEGDVPVYSETLQPTTEAVRRVIPLTAYAGQTVRVAFRYRDVRDANGTVFSSFAATEATAPEVTVEGPRSVRAGQEATFVARVVSSVAIDRYTWNIQNANPVPGVTNDTVRVTWSQNAAGTNNVRVTVTTPYGSATAATDVEVTTCSHPAGEFPYSEDFEDGISCWNRIDGNGDGLNWESVKEALQRLDADSAMAARFARNGSNAAVSWSYYPCSYHQGFWGDEVLADNYLVTQAMQLPDEPMKLVFYARSLGAPTYNDSIEVKITTTAPVRGDDFMITLMPLTVVESAEYVRFIVDLDDYAGQTVYIAFLHHTVGGMAMLIDDVKIVSEVEDIEAAEAVRVTVNPNPTDGVVWLGGAKVQGVEVMDATGRTLRRVAATNRVDISDLPAGVYMLRVTTKNGAAVRKVVKK